MGEPQRRVIASELSTDHPVETVRAEAQSDFLTSFAIYVFRPLWSFRLEVSLIATVIGAWWAMSFAVNVVIATIITTVVVGALAYWPRSRHLVRKVLHNRAVCRRFDRACRYAFLVTQTDRTPIPMNVQQTPAGDVLKVRMPPSMSTMPLADATEVLASGLGVREVRVERDKNRADIATVSIIHSDPLASTPVRWPNLDATRLSMWDAIPIGVDEMGEAVTVSLPERNVLTGGEPGAGKSVAVSMLVATAALDPDCELFLLDGKQVELAVWSGCARGTAGPSVDDAIDLLRLVRTEMDARYTRLLADRKRKVSRGDGIPLQVVVCDELAYYLTMGDRNQCKEFSNLARDVVARGRAAGIVFIAATQKPSHEIIPTSLRDLFAFRWAFRCTTPQSSDTILGQGWASQEYSAATIDPSQRGVGYLLAEGGVPQRMRTFHLTDDDLEALARRAESIRKPEGVVIPIDPAA